MEVRASENLLNNDAHGCFLTIATPGENIRIMKQSLHPLLQWIDPACNMVRIVNSADDDLANVSLADDKTHVSDYTGLSTPSIAVILFLSENGDFSYEKTRRCLNQHPWKLHHSIELSHKWSQARAGRQDFYTMLDTCPLWSVNASYCGPEVLRFTIFVENFNSMVEFYRIVTESEMESQKPRFCIFPLYSQPGLQIELCLKHQKHLKPYPIPSAYLTFRIRNIKALKDVLGVTVSEMKRNQYSVVDPEGNRIILYDMSPGYRATVTYAQSVHFNVCSCDVTSVKSVCDSHDHDSGRFTDSDLCESEAASVENLKYKLDRRLCGEFTDCLMYPHSKDEYNTHTSYIISNKVCNNYRRHFPQGACINTSVFICNCNTNTKGGISVEKHMDKASQGKGTLEMKQLQESRSVQTDHGMSEQMCCSQMTESRPIHKDLVKPSTECKITSKSDAAVKRSQYLHAIKAGKLSKNSLKCEQSQLQKMCTNSITCEESQLQRTSKSGQNCFEKQEYSANSFTDVCTSPLKSDEAELQRRTGSGKNCVQSKEFSSHSLTNNAIQSGQNCVQKQKFYSNITTLKGDEDLIHRAAAYGENCVSRKDLFTNSVRGNEHMIQRTIESGRYCVKNQVFSTDFSTNSSNCDGAMLQKTTASRINCVQKAVFI